MKRMKKLKPLLLIVAAMVIYAVGLSYYFSRMPSLVYVFEFFTSVPFKKDVNFQTCLYRMENMNLEPMDASPGQKLNALGMSFVLDTKESIIPLDNGEHYFNYRVGKDKFVHMEAFSPNKVDEGYPSVGMRDNFRDAKAQMLFEKATGKSPISEYVCEEAFRDVTVWDLSLFDNNKNVGVLIFLNLKSVTISRNMKSYHFDNGNVVGFLNQNDRASALTFFSPKDLNTRQYITIFGFSPTETEAILRTLKFETDD